MTKSKEARLSLRFISDREKDVYVCTSTDQNGYRIGRVYRHADRFGGDEHILLWSARDTNEANHGDSYLEAWGAAKQLALGLKLGDQIGGL